MKKKKLLFVTICSVLLLAGASGCKVDRMAPVPPDDGGDGGGGGGTTTPPVETVEVHNLRAYFASCASVDISNITYNATTDTFIRTATDNISHADLLDFYNLSNANGGVGVSSYTKVKTN